MTLRPVLSDSSPTKILMSRIVFRCGEYSVQFLRRLHQQMRRCLNGSRFKRLLHAQLRPDRLVLVAKYFRHLENLLAEAPRQPLISVILPVYKVETRFLEECLESVAQQIYKNWELCIVDDCSQSKEIDKVIEDFRSRFPNKVNFKKNSTNLHISAASNEALKLAHGEYIALLDHDDRLYPHSLAEVVRHLHVWRTEGEDPDVIYSDERTIDESGEKLNVPFHKPIWSPWMHLSVNYTTHLTVYRRSLIDSIGGFRVGYEGSQDHDLMLRAVGASKKPVKHIPLVLYQWRAHSASTASSASTKPYAAIAGERAVQEHLASRGIVAQVEYEPATVHYRVKPELPSTLPLISIVIPSKDSYEAILKCLESVYQRTTYKNFEIIISDNGSTDPRVLSLYDKYRSMYPERFRTLIAPSPFNFGRQCNRGAAVAAGDYLLFLNNDVEVITPGWMEELLRFGIQQDIGVVGCKLLYPDQTIQHAGITTSCDGVALHAGLGKSSRDDLYNNLLNTGREMAAVSAACFLTRKEIFDSIGGFDEFFLPNAYGDVEYCLRVRRSGLSCFYSPYAELYHYESKSRGLNIELFERRHLSQKFPGEILSDPYVNPNLQATGLYLPVDSDHPLDLNARQFEFFLTHPMGRWLDDASAL